MATKVITGKCRFSYVNIFEPKASDDGSAPKYSVTLLIPKSDTATLNKIKEAMAEARKNFCKNNGENALPLNPSNTLHDGDGLRENNEPYEPECKGCWVITVTNKLKPLIVDNFGNDITDPTEVYSGCYGRAIINFYGYSRNGRKGISAGLLGIKKLHDGVPFITRAQAEDFDDGWTDDSDYDLL